MKTSENISAIKQKDSMLAGHINYRFIDASIPPQYHRSFTISVSPKKVEFEIDCYGEILSKYVEPIPPRDFRKFMTKLRQLTISTAEAEEDQSCSGGKTDSFDIMFDDLNINGYVYHCAGKRSGSLKGHTEELALLFKSLILEFTGKLKAW